MTLDLTFKEVCDSIKKDGKDDPKLIEAVDKLLGLAFVCSPLVVGAAAATLLPTLAVKNEIVKIGKSVFEKLSTKKDDDYFGRQHRMEMAYGLLVFTAFFEALNTQMPKSLRTKLSLLKPEKAFLATEAAAKATSKPKAPDGNEAPLSLVRFSFPHPTESLAQQAARHANLWKQMSRGLAEFVRQLAIWEQASEKEQLAMSAWIEKVAGEAGAFFEAQYFELARRFEDFAVWANLHEHKNTKALISDLSNYVQRVAQLSKSSNRMIDIGFTKLHSAVQELPKVLAMHQASDLVDSLTKHYQARINDPIIEDKEDSQDDTPRLTFPRVRDAFIPQAFRVLRQTAKGLQLEDEPTWAPLPRRNDLGAFLLSYLTSPYSTESPLLVLGHPGSGKSLLTTVLSSQLMSEHFTAIRVPLREVNAEAGIVTQIEDAIRRITNISVDSWAKLSATFRNCPPLVILDGYDELLQASGKVFAGYLKDVQHFQKSEAEQGRPVRVIVTSRVTLIDKATVPAGSTIVRLLEFDESQRERWIGIWNKINVNYFHDAEVEEFSLPDPKESGADKILTLAEQPLLLLMLALYDSQGNQLRRSKGLDRTKLYDSLLRRFVARERGKESGFDNFKKADKSKALDVEMDRLGVAALGMYNRRKVHILAPELNDDLKFFELERNVEVGSGRALSQADLLLGSFFFVHKSKAQQSAGPPETREEISAFEFLHNTLGEFLTADFILRRTLAEVEALRAFQSSEVLRADLEKRLNSADGFKREWFASLVYTPLFTRPVVLEMMREWIPTILKERGLSCDDFLALLDTIVLNQLQRLLNKREMPSIIRKETAQEGYRASFGDHPLLGHVAIYSMNLIVLRAIVCDRPFYFDEASVAVHEDGARPWDRLTYLWRSWFSLDNLNGLTAVMVAERNNTVIEIRAKSRFQVAESQARLTTCLNVAVTLADNISSGLTGLVLFDASKQNYMEIDEVARRLSAEKLDAEFQIMMKRLYHLERSEHPELFFSSVQAVFDAALQADKHVELEHIALTFRRAVRRLGYADLRRRLVHRDHLQTLFTDILEPRLLSEVVYRNPSAGLLLWDVADELGSEDWKYRIYRELLERVFLRVHPDELIERNPEAIFAWAKMSQQFGAWAQMDRYSERRPIEFFARGLDVRFLAKLSDRSPAAALAWIRFARQTGGARALLERHDDDIAEGFDSSVFMHLIDNRPEVAIEWLELLRDAGSPRLIDILQRKLADPAIWDRMLSPRRLSEAVERNPEAVLAWLRVARDFDNGQYVTNALLNSEFVQRMLHPRRLIEVMERDPDHLAVYLELLHQLPEAHALHGHRVAEILEAALHPRFLSVLIQRRPDAALTLLNMAQEMGERDLIKRNGKELFERVFRSLRQRWFLQDDGREFSVVLRLARISESSGALSAMNELVRGRMQASREYSTFIERLPMSAWQDLEWLATESDNSELRLLLRNLVSPSHSVPNFG